MRLRRKKERHDIVRQIYEDNRRILGLDVVPPPQGIGRVGGAFALLAVLVVFFGGAHKERKTSVPAPEEVLATPDEQIMHDFGSTENPRPDDTDLSLVQVYGLGVRTIVLDPGHGGRDAGATGLSGLTEKAVALDVAKRVERQLAERGLLVYLTRTEDIRLSLRQRAEKATTRNADLFVSIHVNALPVDSIAFIETFYFRPRGEEYIEKLAARENFDSGYQLAQWQRSLNSLRQKINVDESRELAQHVQTALVDRVRAINPSVQDWGVRAGPFMVLWEVEVPAILAEISVLSMPEEEERLRSRAYREELATALAAGIISYIARPR